MQLLPMASSPDGLISARYAVITKTPGWEVLTTTSNVNITQGHGGGVTPPPPICASTLKIRKTMVNVGTLAPPCRSPPQGRRSPTTPWGMITK